MPRQRSSGVRSLVGFRVDGLHYALATDVVREVIRPLEVVDMPRLPRALIGVADHRGAVVPVVALRIFFGRAPARPTSRTKWLIIGRPGSSESVGLVVDSVIGVFPVDEESTRAVPPWAHEQVAAGMGEVVCRDDELVFVLDAEAVIEPHLSAVARRKIPEQLA